MATLVRPRSHESVLIDDVSWELYELASNEMCHGATRMVYDNGRLEIMTVGGKHEMVKTAAARVLEYMAVEFDWDVNGLGNVTLRRRDLLVGLEPDECYYIVSQMPPIHDGELDIRNYPPPDLAIEVEVTRSSIDKISIYKRLGVREIWRWAGDRFLVQERDPDGNYHDRADSALLPALDLSMLAEFTLRAINEGQPAALRALRQRIGNA